MRTPFEEATDVVWDSFTDEVQKLAEDKAVQTARVNRQGPRVGGRVTPGGSSGAWAKAEVAPARGNTPEAEILSAQKSLKEGKPVPATDLGRVTRTQDSLRKIFE